MYIQVEKPKENKSRAVANAVGQKKTGVKQGLGFVDNRSEAVAQRKQQEIVNNNIERHHQIIQLKTSTEFTEDFEVSASSSVAKVVHERVDMNADARNVAAQEWPIGGGIPPGTVCNHHIPYKLIRNEIIGAIENKPVPEAVASIAKVGYQVEGGERGFQRNHFNMALDGVIGSTANTPNNLFYWPETSGDQGGNAIDNPNFRPDWVPNWQYLTERLELGRAEVEKNIDALKS